jgi:hypothetical protein
MKFNVFNVDHDFDYNGQKLSVSTTNGTYIADSGNSNTGITDSITVASPLIPTYFTGIAAGQPINTNIGTKTLIGTQTLTLTDTNWNWETPRIFGINGNLSFSISAPANLVWSATISSTSKGFSDIQIAGYLYYSSSQYITVPVNFVSVTSLYSPYDFKTFSIGDDITIKIYATLDPTSPIPVGLLVSTQPQLLQAIFSGLSL